MKSYLTFIVAVCLVYGAAFYKYQNRPIQEKAWDLFQKYLSYNKDQNLAGVKSLVYKISDICSADEISKECADRMRTAYNFGSELKKEEFKNSWIDGKQVILSTDFKTESNDETLTKERSMVFFVFDETQNLKLLSFSPMKGAVVAKSTASEEELLDRVTTYTEDRDQDGIADYDEECLDPRLLNCQKTNPKMRDTDGNGFWDGVDLLMK